MNETDPELTIDKTKQKTNHLHIINKEINEDLNIGFLICDFRNQNCFEFVVFMLYCSRYVIIQLC